MNIPIKNQSGTKLYKYVRKKYFCIVAFSSQCFTMIIFIKYPNEENSSKLLGNTTSGLSGHQTPLWSSSVNLLALCILSRTSMYSCSCFTAVIATASSLIISSSLFWWATENYKNRLAHIWPSPFEKICIRQYSSKYSSEKAYSV